jgi:hypothetical protein
MEFILEDVFCVGGLSMADPQAVFYIAVFFLEVLK